jgi:Tfp pilus assembly protein PilO
MNMTKRERVLVSVVLFLAVICLYYIFLLKPHMDQMRTLNDDISSQELLVSNGQQQLQIINALNKSIAENEEKLSSINTQIAIGMDQPAILVFLNETVNMHAKKVSFTFGEPQQVGQLDVFPVTITMISDYEGIKNTLAAFNDGAYLIKVVSLNISVEAPNEAEAELQTDEEQAVQTAPQPTSIFTNLNATLSVEFYSQLGDLPVGGSHEFAEGYQYGGDIFQ